MIRFNSIEKLCWLLLVFLGLTLVSSNSAVATTPTTVTLSFQNGISKIFLKDTVVVNVSGANLATVALTANNKSAVKITQLAPGPFSIQGLTVGAYTLTAITTSGVKLNSNSLTLSVVSPAGWSSDTGYKFPTSGSVRDKIIRSASTTVGQMSGDSIFCTNCNYKTDVAEGDGYRILNVYMVKAAWAQYADWKVKNTKPTLEQKKIFTETLGKKLGSADIAQSVISAYDKNTNGRMDLMLTQLSSSAYSSATKNLIVTRIISDTNTAIPTNSNQDILMRLHIQKQCAEWAQTLVRNSGGSPPGTIINMNDAAPGMGFVSTLPHTMLIIDVEYDVSGNPINHKVVDANYGSGWDNPNGDVAWDRRVRTGLISTRHLASGRTLHSYDSSSVSFGTPRK